MVAAKRYLKHGLLAGLAAGAVVAGCSPVATGSPGDLAVAKSAEPPAMTASVAPPGVTIWNEEASQAEVVLPSGRRIYIDVGQPALLTVQPKATDVLLVSQQRPHHFDPNFARGFPGQKIVGQSGRLDLGDAVVRTVESSENDSPYEPGQGTNQILVIEAAGLRIVHCGDLDQSALTAGQLTELGRVDVVICPILDPSGTADPTGLKAIDALGQMRPAIVIPTDSSVTTARSAAARWKAWFTAKPLTVLAGHLPDSTTLVFAGTQAQNYAAILSLAEAPGS